MSTPVAYGLDFGTTNSSVAVAYEDGTTEMVELAPGDIVLPSLVYLAKDGSRIAGKDGLRAFLSGATAYTTCGSCHLAEWRGGVVSSACREARPGGQCLDSRLLSQVKSDLADDDFTFTHSWGVDFELEDLVATVLRQLKRKADRAVGADVRRAVIGHPVRFVGAAGARFQDRQDVAKARLVEAGHRAGFDEVALMPESQAAITLDGIGDGIVVCVDFGGGTFDTAVVAVDGDVAEVLALDGVPVGGEEFDGLIFDHVVRPAIGLDAVFTKPDGQQRTLPARLRGRLRSLSGLKSLLADGGVAGSLTNLTGQGHDDVLKLVGELLYGGQAWAFFNAIEAAKIELSVVDQAWVDFRRPWIDLNLPIKRTTFESLITDELHRTSLCLQDALASAEVAPDEIDFVTMTGGSSRIPVFHRMLTDLFPAAELVEADPFSTVSSGLARYGWEEWS